ncbi:uncharacterized protein SCODWIG_03678 [Saccharomycodes ludwigii]|uniref:PHD-type domain-containing protein n=1 Tax=Saccharomycodes ludwigii TaxID=36035 RepID=A0A376BBA6_9ASCO|nr:uncharacterized protein SCODWIG_03678 [Saccharomycodes ludwigii]
MVIYTGEDTLSLHDALPICNNNNIQLSVKDILKEGITVNNFVQEENSFVFTYPGATTFNLSSGVSISEEMNFCAWDWFESYFYGQISSILDEPKKLCSSEALESVPSLQLLMSIYLNGSSLESYNAQSIMQDLLKQEIEQRKLVQRMYPHLTIRYNKFDYISDISAQYTGLSKMMIWYDEGNGYKLKQLSLSEFLKYNDTLPTSKIELHLYYTTETLYFLINDYEEEEQNFKLIPLLKKIVNEDYKNEQIPIEIFEEMLIKTYRNEKDTLVWKYIKNYIESKQGEMNQVCDAFLENYNKVMTNVKVQSILDTFTLIKNNKHIILKLYSIPKEYLIDMADLERLVHVLKTQSSIITLQMKQVFELYNDIKEFQKECMGMATKADYDIDLVETSKLLKKGLDFKIYQPILSVLLTKLQKKQWLLLYKETLESAGTSVNVTSDFLKNLLDTGIQLRVDEPLLINVSETLKGVTKFNLKFDELFKKRKSNHLCKIPIADIEHLLNILNSNIGAFIEEEIKCFLLNIHDSVNASRTGNFTFANKLKYKNDELKNRLISRVNSNYGFLDDELVSYYNQSTNDRRMNKLDVPPNCESVCKKELKKLNDWLKNFHFYFKDLRHLNDLVAKTARCFNLENDRYLHENDDLYCFCRSSDDGHTMVQCEICKDWYHSECLNTETLSNEYIEMTLEQKSFLLKTNEEDNVFICSLCYSGQINLKKYDGIKFQDLQKMLIDSINLLIVPEDSSIIKKLFEFYEISLNYKRFLSGTIFGQASDVTIATAAVANNNQGNKLEIPLGLSTEKCKFYLRKLLGGNCHLTEEIKIMKRYIRKHDINELNKLKRRKMEIITGYPLCEQPKEMNKSFISLPNILDSSMSKSKKTMINDELNVMTQENL